MTVVCTGSIAYDYLMTYPGLFRDYILPEHLDSISLSFLVDSLVRLRGGTAPNIAYTLALLGDNPVLVGTVGEDFEDYRAWLKKAGVDTSFARVIPGEYTASFFANTDKSNAQICSFYTGAMRYASKISLKEISVTKDDLVLISANDPLAMDMYVKESAELGIRYIYDPGQQLARSEADELRRGAESASSLFINEYEYELLKKRTGLSESDLLSRLDYMVVTLAEKGARIYVKKEEQYLIPVVAPECILDPTGVGDAFRAGFLRAYQLGLGWKICGQMGVLAATYCLEQRGTQSHAYTRDEFVARFRKHFDDQGALDVLLS